MTVCPRCNSDSVVLEKSVSEKRNRSIIKRYFYKCLICNKAFGEKV